MSTQSGTSVRCGCNAAPIGAYAARDALLVQLDARDRIELRGVPILGEEIQRRTARDAAEFLVVGAKVLGDRRRMLRG